MSCASYLGSGHRIEFYGEDGTLVLDNSGGDYMRGFRLLYGKRPAAALTPIPVDDPIDAQYPDGRIAPVSRLARRFFDAIEGGAPFGRISPPATGCSSSLTRRSGHTGKALR